MEWEDELSEQENDQKRPQKPKSDQNSDEDEGTLEYAERPAFAAVDTQESVFDRSSLNRQHGINTQPSIFHSTWK